MFQKTMPTKKVWGLMLVVFLVASINITDAVGAIEYPLRAKYSMVNPITTDELLAVYNKAIIVDARNAAEYNVIHMTGAANILVGKMTEAKLLKLRPKKDNRPLVFYCNGITCAKSYKASKKAIQWGFTTVRCYDPGIFAWAKAVAEKTEFFGKILGADELKAVLISKDRFKEALLPSKEFLSRSRSGEYTVIDIRDPNERSETKFHLRKMKVMSFDNMIKLINAKSKAVPTSNLLVLDNVGKQVRWLQYHLENAGIKNYYFLKGGIRQLIKDGFSSAG